MFSYTNCLFPTSLQDLFVRNSEVHIYNTRHKNDPHVTSINNSLVSRTFNLAALAESSINH